MESIQIKLPTGNIKVDIIRKPIKNVHLKVFRDMSAILSVPINTPYSWAEEFVLSKSKWLDKQYNKYNRSSGYNNLSFLKSGSSTQFLGKDLRVFIKQDNKEKIILDEKSVTIFLPNPSDETRANAIFEKWWRKRALEIYGKLIDQWMPVFTRHNIERPILLIKKMKTLWGSCKNDTHKITLNEYLLKADIRCIEYVVLHELTHLLHACHNKAFYDFLTIYMPDWKERKKQLDTEVVQGL